MDEVPEMLPAPAPREGRFYPPAYTSQDVAAVRRKLIAYTRSPLGISSYAAACAIGRQGILPDVAGPAAQGRVLAQRETDRLIEADLWFATADTVALTGAAFAGYPDTPCRPWSLPSRYGLVLFGAPLLARQIAPREMEEARKLYQGQIPENPNDRIYVTAASWGPFTCANWGGRPGYWVSFYADSGGGRVFWSDSQSKYAHLYAPMMSEDQIAFRVAEESEEIRPVLGADRTSISSWGRMLLCAFEIMRQAHLVTESSEPVYRSERRRAAREGIPEPKAVRCIDVRRSKSAAVTASRALTGESGGYYKHRFPVSGHWKDHWYPSKQAHVRRYIEPYWKGPEDAPLLVGDKVKVF